MCVAMGELCAVDACGVWHGVCTHTHSRVCALLLLSGGVHDGGQLAPLVPTSRQQRQAVRRGEEMQHRGAQAA